MRRALAFPLLALLAGCSDTTGPTLTLPAGQLRVWYEAGAARSLDASGPLTLTEGRFAPTGFAAAGQNPKVANKLTIVGFTPQAENGTMSGRVFALTIAASGGPRTVPILENCWDTTCAATLFFDGVDASDPHREVDPRVDRTCVLTAGTVTFAFATYSSHLGTYTHVAGTFSGTGYCVYDRRYDPLTPFAVDSARFAVPVDVRYRPRVDLY